MLKQIGAYNVDFAGPSWEGNVKYQMVLIQKFDKDAPVGKQKCLFFRDDREHEIPNFKSEKDIDFYMSFANNSKLSVRTVLTQESYEKLGNTVLSGRALDRFTDVFADAMNHVYDDTAVERVLKILDGCETDRDFEIVNSMIEAFTGYDFLALVELYRNAELDLLSDENERD